MGGRINTGDEVRRVDNKGLISFGVKSLLLIRLIARIKNGRILLFEVQSD
jgi:hypothetical protein